MTHASRSDDAPGRLVPARWVRPAAITALVAVGLLTALSVDVSHRVGPGTLDSLIGDKIIAQSASGYDLAHQIASLGGPGPVVLIAFALAAFLWYYRRYRAAVLVVVTPAVASAITEWLLKPLVQRIFVDGPAHGVGFPSGHTTGIFSLAFAVVLITLTWRLPQRPNSMQWAVSAGALLVAAAVAFSLVSARFHYATDVLGGFLVALITVLAAALAIDAGTPRVQRLIAARRAGSDGSGAGDQPELGARGEQIVPGQDAHGIAQ